MSTDATERRLSPRIPFRADLQVQFERMEAATPAQAGNISAAGMEFRIPWHKEEQSRVGEEVVLRFSLPGREDISVRALICNERLDEEDGGKKQYLACGVKFLDLAGESWRLIQSYCQARIPQAGGCGAIGNAGADPADLTKRMRRGRPVALEIQASLIVADGRIVRGRIEDAGYGGMEIACRQEIAPGTPVRVRVNHEHIRLDLEGVCVWSRGYGDGRAGCLHGIHISIPDRTQFEMLRDLLLILVRSTK